MEQLGLDPGRRIPNTFIVEWKGNRHKFIENQWCPDFSFPEIANMFSTRHTCERTGEPRTIPHDGHHHGGWPCISFSGPLREPEGLCAWYRNV